MKESGGTRRRWGLLLALSGILFLLRLGGYEFISPDEPRFALIGQEMLRTRELIAPKLQGEIYSNKPPLYLWLVVLFSLPLGRVTEWSARLPSALAAVGGVLLTFAMGRRLLGERASWLGALVLMTAGHFLMRGRWASTDMTLCFFFLLAMFLLSRSLLADPAGGIRRPYAHLFFAATALATLTKGPIGIVLPVGILVITLLVERRGRELLRYPWPAGIGIFLLLVFPWYFLYGLHAGGEKLITLLLTENVGRYLRAWNNVQPFYFYLSRFPLSFLPWSVFFPALAYALIRGGKDRSGPAVRFLLVWFAVVFLFFSFSSGKRTVYLLPLFPAAALLVGWFLDRGLEALGGPRSRWARGTVLALASLFLAAGASAPVLAGLHYPEATVPAIWVGMALAGASIPVALGGWRGKVPTVVGAVAAATVSAILVSALWLFPKFGDYHNVRNLSSRIQEIVPSGSRFATVRKKREAFLFYTGFSGEEIRNGEDLSRFLSIREPAYCLLRESDWNRISRERKISGRVLLRGPVSRHTFVLVSNEVTHAHEPPEPPL